MESSETNVSFKPEIDIIYRYKKKLIYPLPRGGRQISTSPFPSRRPFAYHLHIASYGTIIAAKWASNGRLLQFQSNLFKVTKI